MKNSGEKSFEGHFAEWVSMMEWSGARKEDRRKDLTLTRCSQVDTQHMISDLI